MKLNLIIILFTVLCDLYSFSQTPHYTPEITFGNRSISFQHFIKYDINKDWSLNNVTLFDSEYENKINDIFFIRNMLSYSINKSFKSNIAFGIKNPGSFLTSTVQYVYQSPRIKLSYHLGATFQKDFTLEQSINLYLSKQINKSSELFMSVFAVLNTNFKSLGRRIQQFRIGKKKKQFQISLAINLDQFNKSKRSLENYGIAIKFNI